MEDTGDWTYPLFGCFNNCGLCIKTFICPCITFGQVMEKFGESCLTCGLLCPCVGGPFLLYLRNKIRKEHNIAATLTNDFLVSMCCAPCALVQEAAELLGTGEITEVEAVEVKEEDNTEEEIAATVDAALENKAMERE